MSRGRREWVAAACVLLGLSACATGGGGRGSGSPFPSRAEIDALTHGTGAISPFEQAVVDADAWTFGEPLVEVLETSDYVDPSPWGKSLSEQVAADPARLRGTSAMHCAAREHARFYLQYAAVPAISLRQAMMEHCGSVSVDAIPLYLYGPVETEHTDAALHRAWAPSVARMVRESTRSGRRELGIAFARDGDIYVMNADGSRAHRISDINAEESDPAWSPDGKLIAYIRRTPGTPIQNVWVMQPDGSERRPLTKQNGRAFTPAWSPDGTRIVFTTNAGSQHFELFTIGTDGKGLRSVVPTASDDFEPSWSPDGSKIAYQEEGAIFTIELGGDRAVDKLTDYSTNDSSPVWNPRPAATD